MSSKSDDLSNLILEISKKFKQKLSCGVEELAPDLSIKEIHLIEFIGSKVRTMGEIAQDLGLTPGTITPIVDKLVNLNYLKRERDEEVDRRKVFITLDKKGVKIEEVLTKQRLRIARAVLKNMPEEDQDKVLMFFNKILANLESDCD